MGYFKLAEGGTKIFTLIGHIPWIARFIMWIPGKASKDMKKLRENGFARARARQEKGSERKDVFYYLSDELGAEKQKIPMEVVTSDAGLVIFAGSDTTKTVLSSLFFYLLRDPAKLAKLREEIDRFYPPGESVSSKHFQEMTYLDACINETLRLAPPVPSASPRDVGPNPNTSKGRTFGSYYFPEGTALGVSPFVLHRDPKNFSPFTEEYWPERWLIVQGSMKLPSSVRKAEFVHNSAAFIPFSYGPANCVGKPLALLELRMTTVNVLQNLDVKFQDGYEQTWEEDWSDQFVIIPGKLPVVFSSRK